MGLYHFLFIFLHHNLFITYTFVGVQASFLVRYRNRVILRIKCIGYIGKRVLNSHLGANPDWGYIQNRVIKNRVIKNM